MKRSTAASRTVDLFPAPTPATVAAAAAAATTAPIPKARPEPVAPGEECAYCGGKVTSDRFAAPSAPWASSVLVRLCDTCGGSYHPTLPELWAKTAPLQPPATTVIPQRFVGKVPPAMVPSLEHWLKVAAECPLALDVEDHMRPVGGIVQVHTVRWTQPGVVHCTEGRLVEGERSRYLPTMAAGERTTDAYRLAELGGRS